MFTLNDIKTKYYMEDSADTDFETYLKENWVHVYNQEGDFLGWSHV